ncbi:MAG: phosphatase PAP2 family protein [Clostridia bacterium]
MSKLFNKRDIIIAAGVLLALMIVGSFFDYQISCALFDMSNVFGIAFAVFGELPAMIGLTVAGVLLLKFRNKDKKAIMVMQIFFGALLVIYGTASTLIPQVLNVKWNMAVMIAIAVMLNACAILAVCKITQDTDRKTAIRVAISLIISIFAIMIVINIIKVPWARPRMRLIASNQDAIYQPWWVVGSGLKETLVAAGAAAEDFKSFPSGHTSNAVNLVLLVLFSKLNVKLENKKSLLFYIGFVWALIVALSRIIMGAHFLTDTVVGIAIGLLICVLVSSLVFKKDSKI